MLQPSLSLALESSHLEKRIVEILIKKRKASHAFPTNVSVCDVGDCNVPLIILGDFDPCNMRKASNDALDFRKIGMIHRLVEIEPTRLSLPMQYWTSKTKNGHTFFFFFLCKPSTTPSALKHKVSVGERRRSLALIVADFVLEIGVLSDGLVHQVLGASVVPAEAIVDVAPHRHHVLGIQTLLCVHADRGAQHNQSLLQSQKTQKKKKKKKKRLSFFSFFCIQSKHSIRFAKSRIGGHSFLKLSFTHLPCSSYPVFARP